MEWKPIESAPKDGTWILCFISYANDPKCRVVKWMGEFWGDNHLSGWFDGAIIGWIPLPALPRKEHTCLPKGANGNAIVCQNNMTGLELLLPDRSRFNVEYCPFCGEKS